MNRSTLVAIHMYLSAFFAPMVILVAVSGGLYLIGVKGELVESSVYSDADTTLDTASASLKADVEALLAKAGVSDYGFDYVKVKGNTLYTRPTSRDHYIIKLGQPGVEIRSGQPNLQHSMMEMHMGHGPTAFKTFQKFFAAGVLLMMLSGLWLGLSAVQLRGRTLLTSGAGLLVFLLLGL